MYKIIHKERTLKFLPNSISATMCFVWYFHSVLVVWQLSYQRVHIFKATHILFLSVAWHVSPPFILIFILVLFFGIFLLVWCFKTFCRIIPLCPYCLILLFIYWMFGVFKFLLSTIIPCLIFLLSFLSCYECKISAIATFCKFSETTMSIFSLKVPKP